MRYQKTEEAFSFEGFSLLVVSVQRCRLISAIPGESYTINCALGSKQSVRKSVLARACFSQTSVTFPGDSDTVRVRGVSVIAGAHYPGNRGASDLNV